MFLILFLLVYWFLRVRHGSGQHMDVSSARALEPGEVQLMVAQVPPIFKNMTIYGDAGCEYDVFADGIPRINQPLVRGTTNLWRPCLNPSGTGELMVVSKKNTTQQRLITPSVVRFH